MELRDVERYVVRSVSRERERERERDYDQGGFCEREGNILEAFSSKERERVVLALNSIRDDNA